MLKTADIFQSGMILQRQKPVAVWGAADAGAVVQVSFMGQKIRTCADGGGHWCAVLAPMEAAENVRMTVEGCGETIIFEDVAVGEVWLAGGQSNMEFHMRYEKHLQEEKPLCGNVRLRFYDVPEIAYDDQEKDFDYTKVGIWRKACPEEIDYFSAAGYYFQKSIERELDVPVGIIGCNWGGTTSSVWMNPRSVERAGKPWMDLYLSKSAGIDWDAYWEAQRKNPMNSRGDLFADPFGEFILPRTPSQEEIAAFFAKTGMEGPDPNALSPQEIPGTLYEHMLKKAAPFGIRGFLWYQGESDDVPGCQSLYERMLSTMIADWRALWQDVDLPFLLVQLPGYRSWLDVPACDYVTIRRCQKAVADADENTYFCSISDAGEEYDIHPKNKKVVGERLALLALGHVYGRDILCDAPTMQEIRRDKDVVEITFANAGSGLTIKGEELSAMEVTADGQSVPFAASVLGDRLRLSLRTKVNGKLKLAFAWTNWYLVNLYNGSGLPAVPFEAECE